MTRLNLLLAALLMASCLLLVKTSYEARRLVTQLDQAQKEQRQLDAEFKRLDAERQTEGTHQKVSRVAASRLKMAPPPLTLYVDSPALEAAAPISPVSPTDPDGPETPGTRPASTDGLTLAARSLRTGGTR